MGDCAVYVLMCPPVPMTTNYPEYTPEPAPPAPPLPLYPRHNPDLIHNRYSFRVCRTLAYSAASVTTARFAAFIAEVDGLWYLVGAGWIVWWLVTLPQVLAVVANLRSGRTWCDGIKPLQLLLLVGGGAIGIAGLFMEIHRVKG